MLPLSGGAFHHGGVVGRGYDDGPIDFLYHCLHDADTSGVELGRAV